MLRLTLCKFIAYQTLMHRPQTAAASPTVTWWRPATYAARWRD